MKILKCSECGNIMQVKGSLHHYHCTICTGNLIDVTTIEDLDKQPILQKDITPKEKAKELLTKFEDENLMFNDITLSIAKLKMNLKVTGIEEVNKKADKVMKTIETMSIVMERFKKQLDNFEKAVENIDVVEKREEEKKEPLEELAIYVKKNRKFGKFIVTNNNVTYLIGTKSIRMVAYQIFFHKNQDFTKTDEKLIVFVRTYDDFHNNFVKVKR